jgi:hypothetical protein
MQMQIRHVIPPTRRSGFSRSASSFVEGPAVPKMQRAHSASHATLYDDPDTVIRRLEPCTSRSTSYTSAHIRRRSV